jgi:hypothetical protein
MKAPMGRLSKTCRAVVAASLLGAGICFGVLTVSWLGAGISLGAITVSSPPVGAAHELCRVSAVVIPNGRTPSPYRCSAKVHVETLNRGALFGLGTRVALVDWEIHGP